MTANRGQPRSLPGIVRLLFQPLLVLWSLFAGEMI
jgi:hypothetical protein